jgi:3-phenylpropionate/cinnamic acid dioxygenase small subunit
MAMELSELADRAAIQQLMYRYAMAVDGRDWALYRTVFSADAVIDYTDSGGIRADLETTVKWLDEVLGIFAGLQHNMTNHVVEIDGDRAQACTYYVAYHTLADGEGSESVLVMGGFYRDRLVSMASGWRISERVELGEWMQGPYPEGVAKPPWYGTPDHHRASLPG